LLEGIAYFRKKHNATDTHDDTYEIREQAKPLKKCCERTSARKRINFDNICEIIQTSDGFSRHYETYYGLMVVKTTPAGRFILLKFFTNWEPPHWKISCL
jgi:hypothetical protein